MIVLDLSFSRQREMELGNLAEDKEAEDREDSSDGNRHSGDEDEGESSKGGGGNKRNVARTFRYMRKRPTIIFYKPPEGELLCLGLCVNALVLCP